MRKTFNHSNPATGDAEHVDATTMTVQGSAMSIPEIMKRVILGTIDPSGFIRTDVEDLYDGHVDNMDEYTAAPTFGMTFAEADDFIRGKQSAARSQAEAAAAAHQQHQAEPPVTPPTNPESASAAASDK